MSHPEVPCPYTVLLAASLLTASSLVQAAAQPAARPSESWQAAVSSEESLGEEPFDFSIPLTDTSLSKTDTSKFSSFKPPASGWNAKAGVDYAPPSTPAAMLQSDLPLPNKLPQPQSGPAWAKVTAPGLDSPLSWDQATIETRFDPVLDQSQVGMSFTRSVPLGSELSLKWQNGYSLTQTLPALNGAAALTTVSPVSTGAAVTPAQAATSVLSTNQALSLNILPSDTTISVGASLSSADDKWLPTLSANQKLFGGPFNVTGTVSQTMTGEVNKTITGGFKHSW